MPAPTQPTIAILAAEAFRQFGNDNPSSAETTAAQEQGMDKVKRDIWALGKKWRLLRTSQYFATKVGVSRYANPSDFEQDLERPGMTLLDGSYRGTLQAAAAGTATLAAAEPASQAAAEGHLLCLTSGTTQAEQIDDYNITSKVATMRANWGTTPAGTETYLIADSHWPIVKEPWRNRNLILRPSTPGRPDKVYEMGASATGFIELSPTPDAVYMVKRDYYANLLLVDTSATLHATILRNWAGVITQGLLAWLMTHYRDTRAEMETRKYANQLQLLRAELDDMNESNLQSRVTD